MGEVNNHRRVAITDGLVPEVAEVARARLAKVVHTIDEVYEVGPSEVDVDGFEFVPFVLVATGVWLGCFVDSLLEVGQLRKGDVGWGWWELMESGTRTKFAEPENRFQSITCQTFE